MAFPPIEDLLAHRGTMLLVDRVVAVDGDAITVAARVSEKAWYVDDAGHMPCWIGIELMAQAVAAYVGYHARRAGRPPKQGMLLGTRKYVAHSPSVPVGGCLLVTAKEVFREENGLAAFDAVISREGQPVAEATLKVFEPDDFEAVLEAGNG